MAQAFDNYIDGAWVPSASGRTFENINPSDISSVLGVYPRSSADDVHRAVEAATGARAAWAAVPPSERADLIAEAGRALAQRRAELAAVISRENGKTVKSAIGDVQSGVEMAKFAAGEGKRWYGRTTHSGLRRRFTMTTRVPIGVVGIITSWNFPMAISCWKALPALVCGNTVVLKSEERTPESAVRLAEILHAVGIPPGVFNVVHGTGPEAGEALTRHPNVDMISFTGSSAVGRLVATACAARLAKVSLELGGKNAAIVLPDADLDLAVDGIVGGAFSLSGQRCTATSRVIVHRSVYTAVLDRLVRRTSALRVGPGSDELSDVTPLISAAQCERVMGYLDRCRAEGGRIVVGGERLKGGCYDQGYYIAPTIVDHVAPDMEIAREEVFGPVLTVFPADSYEEAMRIHNDASYGLSASVFTADVNQAFSFFADAEAGVCYVNAPTFGSEAHLPFGGLKQSGLGHREAGWSAIEAFSEVKTLYVDYSARIQNVQFVQSPTGGLTSEGRKAS